MSRKFDPYTPSIPLAIAWNGEEMGLAMCGPPADVLRIDDLIVVRLELAGARPEDLRVWAGAGEVVVRGMRRDPLGDRARRIVQMEIPFGPFERTIALPEPVLADEAEARLHLGLLQIELPVARPQHEPLGRSIVAIIVLGEST
jgi:HSP20 family protein